MLIEGFMEIELMVTPMTTNGNRRRQGEYRAICQWKMEWQSLSSIAAGQTNCQSFLKWIIRIIAEILIAQIMKRTIYNWKI